MFSLRTTSDVDERRSPASESRRCCNSEASQSEDILRSEEFLRPESVIETFELLLLLPIPRPSEVFLLKIGMSEVRRPLRTGLGDFELWQLLQVSDELDFRLFGAESFLPSDEALLLLT